MATIKLGKVRPEYKGLWQETSNYEALDWVLYNDEAWISIADAIPAQTIPNEANSAFWIKFGAKGSNGDTIGEIYNYSKQAIINCADGIYPDKFSTLDCNALPASFITSNISEHTSPYNYSGKVSSSGNYAVGNEDWRAFDNNADSSWISNENLNISEENPIWIRYDFSTPRILSNVIQFYSGILNEETGFLKTFKLIAITPDNNEDILLNIVNYSDIRGDNILCEFNLIVPENIKYKSIILKNTDIYKSKISISKINFNFLDVENDSITILNGLQSTYSENNLPKITNTLQNNIKYTIENFKNSTQYLYGNIDMNNNFESFAITEIPLEVSSVRRGFKIYDLYPEFEKVSDISCGNSICALNASSVFAEENSIINITNPYTNTIWKSLNNTAENIVFTFNEPQRILGFRIKCENVENAPSNFTISVVNDLDVETVIHIEKDKIFKENNDLYAINFADIIIGKSIKLNITAGKNKEQPISLLYAEPIISNDWFNSRSNIIRNKSDENISRSYIGNFNISENKIKNYVCFSKGVETIIPINGGEYINKNSTYTVDTPFILSDNFIIAPEIFINGRWIEIGLDAINTGIYLDIANTKRCIYVKTLDGFNTNKIKLLCDLTDEEINSEELKIIARLKIVNFI